ncbi:hypothetical protein HMPREF9120_01327 [Neisseria sp. oral taxon 020 str. F0370]|nr:hypothetical protein HMPREF9120_01327 [Neisseria sp. oral taxon 020 str. F0370]
MQTKRPSESFRRPSIYWFRCAGIRSAFIKNTAAMLYVNRP